MEAPKAQHKITMRNGMFYLTEWLDKNGNPHVTKGSPGFAERKLCYEYADGLANRAAAPVAEEVEEESADPVDEQVDTGDVTAEPPAGTTTLESQDPTTTVDPALP